MVIYRSRGLVPVAMLLLFAAVPVTLNGEGGVTPLLS